MDIPVILLVLLFSVIVHECAHGLAAEYFGDPTARLLGRLTLNPLSHIDPVGTIAVPLALVLLKVGLVFGWAKPVPVNGANLRDPARQYPLVAAAGPASNLLLAAGSALLLGLLVGVVGMPHARPGATGVGGTAHWFLVLLFQYGIQINVLLALFNLIPLPPLDGSWILRRFLRADALRIFESLRPFGFMLLILLYMAGGKVLLHAAVVGVSGLYLRFADLVVQILR